MENSSLHKETKSSQHSQPSEARPRHDGSIRKQRRRWAGLRMPALRHSRVLGATSGRQERPDKRTSGSESGFSKKENYISADQMTRCVIYNSECAIRNEASLITSLPMGEHGAYACWAGITRRTPVNLHEAASSKPSCENCSSASERQSAAHHSDRMKGQ